MIAVCLAISLKKYNLGLQTLPVKHSLLIFFIALCGSALGQSNALCIQKSTSNNYIAGSDTTLVLYKAISQNEDEKILLFTIRTAINYIPVLAKTDVSGNILWSSAILSESSSIELFNAIVLRDSSIFVFCIEKPSAQNPAFGYHTLWFDKNGVKIQQKSYQLKSTLSFSATSATDIKLSETVNRHIIFGVGIYDQTLAKSFILAGNINTGGDLQWAKCFTPSFDNYNILDLITTNDNFIIQGHTLGGQSHTFVILNSTKISQNDGSILTSISHRDYSYLNFGSTSSAQSVITDDYRIKTLISWRINGYYQLYYSFTFDSSLNLLKNTTFHTPNTPSSYVPTSVSLNKKGMSIIKTAGTFAGSNTGFFITDVDDNVLVQKKIDPNSNDANYTTYSKADVSLENSDSLYFYWNDKVNGKNTVRWIKTGVEDSGDFCGVTDSSFVLSNYYPMSEYNWKLNSFADNIFEPVTSTLTTFSPSISRDIVCEKISGFCNPIKINKLPTICSISEPVKITVNKNQECKGAVLFRFDTSAVKSWQQPDDTTLLLSFDKSWQGDIYAAAPFCPLAKDTFHLIVNAPYINGISLGSDTILCKGDILYLTPGINLGSYTWQNGATNENFKADKGGLYYVTVKDNCDRLYSDSIKIALIDKKPSVGADLSICKKETVELKVKGDFNSFFWIPNYNISNVTSKTVLANPEITTNYFVTTTTKEGCIAKDTITILVKDCPQNFFIPSGFTPNNDGRNDFFKPVVTAPLEKYEFSIYNRWGQRIFYSTNILKGWDGKLSGQQQDNAVFVWTCTYKFYDKPVEYKKGSFTLIR